MSKNLLLEIGTEEMPANIMSGVVDQLKALPALKELTAPINDYLDNVMVMVEDEAVKNNRISQHLATLALFITWGDFSKLV